jgi:hypothetical protein
MEKVKKAIVLIALLLQGCGGYFVDLQGYPYETDNSGQQLSTIWGMNIDEEGVYTFEGFADYDFNDGKNELITHPAIRRQLWGPVGIITEFRYNGYTEEKTLIAPGISIRLRGDGPF